VPFCPPEETRVRAWLPPTAWLSEPGMSLPVQAFSPWLFLEDSLRSFYEAVDIVTTPSGDPVAMVHCNNFTSDLNAWVGLFREFSELIGAELSMGDLYSTLYKQALLGDKDCGGLLAYCYLSGEHITNFEEGRPCLPGCPTQISTWPTSCGLTCSPVFGALRIGMDILIQEEKVKNR